MLVAVRQLRVFRRAQPLHEQARLARKPPLHLVRAEQRHILRAHQVQIIHALILKRHAAQVEQRVEVADAAPVDLIFTNRAHIGQRVQFVHLPRRNRPLRVRMDHAEPPSAQRQRQRFERLIILISRDDKRLHGFILSGGTLRALPSNTQQEPEVPVPPASSIIPFFKRKRAAEISGSRSLFLFYRIYCLMSSFLPSPPRCSAT